MRQPVNDGGQNGEDALKRGLSLFNAQDYFEAHEVWEEWWRATTSPEKQNIQAIIQVAVAMHHYTTGNCEGARSVMERALRNLEDAGDEFRGLDLVRLRGDMRQVIQQLSEATAVTFFKIVRP
jgi:predicted metal-dependent hydrolase